MKKKHPPLANAELPPPGGTLPGHHGDLTDVGKLSGLILEQAPAAMAVLDREGRVLHLTPSFTQLLGYTREDLPHIEAWWPLAYPDPAYRQEIRAIWDRDLAQSLAGGSNLHSGEALVRRKDGSSLWVEGHARFTAAEVILVMVDVSDRKRAELEVQRWAHEAEAAQRQAAWLRLALDVSGAGIWEWEPETDLQFWSPALWKLFGLYGEGAAGAPGKPDIQRWEELIHPEDRPGVIMAISSAVAEGRDFQAEYRLSWEDGLRWLLVRGSPIPPDGPRPRRYLGIVMDISDLRQAERDLAAERTTLRTLFDATPDVLFLKDTDHRYRLVNPAFCRLVGRPAEQILGLGDEDLFPPEVAVQFRENDAVVFGQDQNLSTESVLTGADGERHWFETLKTPLRDSAGVVTGFFGVARDITTTRQLAHRLAEEEERWSFALQGAGLGVWDWHIDTGEVFWSRDWLGMLGYGEGELTPSPEVWNDLLHPEDRERVSTYAAAFFADPGGRYELEFRLRHRQGHWVDILSRATLARDPQGQVIRPRRLVGTHLDMTERKALLRSIRAAGLRYEAMRETTPGGFCVLSPEGRILEVNDAYCRQSGYRRAELETLSIADLEAIENREQTERHLRYLMERGADRFETLQRRKNGQLWEAEVSASYSPVEGGRIFCFLHDITARRRVQRLAELRQRLLELLPLGDQDQLLQAALDVAEELTHSQIGFLHFVLPDQQEVSLQVWSTRTLTEMCFAEGQGRHYPVSEAGVWADCIYQRRAVIHNDYASLPYRKGLPMGHAPVIREATVPLVVDGRVLAVIGVGNKPCDYTDEDLDLLWQVIEMVMDFAERQKVGQRLEYVAFYDVLTGLPNRTLAIDRLSQAIPLSARSRQLLAVGYLNLDAFKPVNDNLGRQIGDAVLTHLGQRLLASLRQGDSVARVGGDEFAILLTGLGSSREGLEAAQRILGVINQPIEVRGHRLHLSASMGLTLYPTDNVGPDALLHHAQEAMYQAKGQHRGGYHLYAPVQDQQDREQRQRRQDFALALRTDQLQLHYQPKLDLSDGRVVGVEALLRWRHPRDGLLEPGRFLPLIKDTPLEIALDEWVLAAALAQRQRWREAGLDLAVSVNISPRYLQMGELADYLSQTLAEYPASGPEGLEIEILEVAEIRDPQGATQVMTACKALGCSFSLDDFGTGFASLTHLHHLPIDKVKIDQRFVRNLLDKVKDLAIVEGVLQIARALPRPVLAEGIESLEVGFLLHQLGCQYGQGFAIARPMPAEAIPAWLEGWAAEGHWHGLAAATTNGAPPDLNVALFSLRRWVDDILAYLRGDNGRTLPPLDEHQCPFCRWYHGIGEVRYGARPQYAFLQARHHGLHRLASELTDLVDTTPTRTPLALDLIRQFEVKGEELLSLVRGLEA